MTGPGYVIATGNLAGSGGSIKYASGPSPRTLVAEALDSETAVANAEVSPNRFKADALFLYGSDPELRSALTTPTIAIGGGPLPVTVQARNSGLRPGTTYYYCAVGIAREGETVRGEIRSFRTDGTPP